MDHNGTTFWIPLLSMMINNIFQAQLLKFSFIDYYVFVVRNFCILHHLGTFINSMRILISFRWKRVDNLQFSEWSWICYLKWSVLALVLKFLLLAHSFPIGPDGDQEKAIESMLLGLYGKLQKTVELCSLPETNKNITIMIDDVSLMEVAANGSSNRVLDFLHYCYSLTTEYVRNQFLRFSSCLFMLLVCTTEAHFGIL